MTISSDQHRVFKAILRAIATDEFSAEDYEAAMEDLRSGRLASLVEDVLTVLAASGGPHSSPQKKSVAASIVPPKRKDTRSSKSADDLFNDIRRRKISRDKLGEIFRSLDPSFAGQLDNIDTLRNIVSAYRSHATDREWQILTSIVNGAFESDPYLNRISK